MCREQNEEYAYWCYGVKVSNGQLNYSYLLIMGAPIFFFYEESNYFVACNNVIALVTCVAIET